MFKFRAVLLVEGESLAEESEAGVFCLDVREIFVVTANEDFTSVDDVVKKSTRFVSCE